MSEAQIRELFGYVEVDTYVPGSVETLAPQQQAAFHTSGSPNPLASSQQSPTPLSNQSGFAVPPLRSPTQLNSESATSAAKTNSELIAERFPSWFNKPMVKIKPKVTPGYVVKELRPIWGTRFNGQGDIINYLARPQVPVPRIIVIEEYTTVSYLGNYGAGRAVKTFSLLPGEKTTISVRTYKDKITTVESSKNVIDSLSASSATELDTLIQREQGNMSSSSDSSSGSGSSYSTTTDSQNSSKSFGISGGLNLGFVSVGGGYGKSISDVSTSSGGMSSTYDYNHTGVRQSNINALDSAMQKHVQQSNSQRTIDVNTTTSDTAQSGEEDVTVRELKNVNLNNTLNFVFRQLLQEYTTITYLSNLKFAYTNGYPESFTMVDLNNLPNMLMDIIDTTDPTTMPNVLCKLLNPYCSVMNWEDDFKQFVEKVTVPFANCLQLGGNCSTQGTETLYRINKACIDTYNVSPLDLSFNGVILSVKKQTLQTSSVYADALLGRGDALDCFNQKAQNSENIASYINNIVAMQRLEDSMQTTTNNQAFADQQIAMGAKQIEVTTQQMDVINGLSAVNDKATLYKKVFGECCDVPQSCCGGGCGCDCADKDSGTP